jgi:UDP-N-acetylglucosamine 4-epimerase
MHSITPSARYRNLRQQLDRQPKHWLITGAAGFIGSNLLKTLLLHNQRVTGLDNFSTGHRHNLAQVQQAVSSKQWAHFSFIEGDIRDLQVCQRACHQVDYVLHQAALGSVSRSIEDPIATTENNVMGFVNMLVAAHQAGAKRFVYAASSATYGDHPDLPKQEDKIGKPLSPYALSKRINEEYADVFARVYGLTAIGLRYFNVFGPFQDPNGAYAAVIPKWIAAMIRGETVCIHGDGETSRDFCYVDNAVQANLLAAVTDNPKAVNQVYNIAVGDRTSLRQLFTSIRDALTGSVPEVSSQTPQFGPFRDGDVRHSQADIAKAQALLGYAPTHRIADGMQETVRWYLQRLNQTSPAS